MAIFDIAFLALFGYLLFCALIQARRGGIRSCISFVIVLASALFAFFGAQPIAGIIMGADISSAGITLADGTLATSLNQLIMDSITAEPTIQDLINASPNIKALIEQLPVALIAEILFLLIFLFLKPVTLFIYAIAKIFVPKRDKEGNKLKKSYLAGLAFCLARTIVTVSVIMIPVSGIMNLADAFLQQIKTEAPAVPAPAAMSAEGGDNTGTSSEMDELVDTLSFVVEDSYKNGMVYPILDAIQLNKLYTGAFYQLSAIELDDGKGNKVSTTLFGEIEGLLPAIGQILQLTNETTGIDFSNLQVGDLTKIANILDTVASSDIIAGVASDVIRDLATGLVAGETRYGMSLDTMEGDQATKDTITDLLEVFADDDYGLAEFQVDIEVISACIKLLDDADFIASITVSDGEEMDFTAILEAFMTEKENGSDLYDAVVEQLSESPRLGSLTGIITNTGLYLTSSALGIPYDKKEVYNTMMNDVNTAFAENDVTTIQMTDVEGVIVSMADGGTAYLPLLPDVALLASGGFDGASSYERFVAVYVGIVNALDKAGLDYEGVGITYKIGGNVYCYNATDKVWSRLDIANKKPTAASQLAQMLFDRAQNENDGEPFTVEKLQRLATAIALAIGDSTDEEMKAIVKLARSLEAPENFETKRVTFKESLKIDIKAFKESTKEQKSNLTSAMKDLLVVAKDVIAAPDNGTDAGSNPASALLNSETLEKFGGVLDKLNRVEAAPENFSGNLLQGIVDTLDDEGDTKILKDTLSGVIESMKENEDVSYGQVLGGVGTIAKTIFDVIEFMNDYDEGKNPDVALAEAELAEGLKNICGIDDKTLSLIVDAVVDMLESEDQEEANESTVILTQLLSNIATYKPETDTVFENDAKQMLALYMYVSDEENADSTTSHEYIAEIMGFVTNSALLSHMSANIVEEFAENALAGTEYMGIPLTREDLFTDPSITDFTADGVSKGDKYVYTFFTILKNDAMTTGEGAAKQNQKSLELALEIIFFYMDSDGDLGLVGASFAASVNDANAKPELQARVDELHDMLKGTVYESLIEILD